MVVPSNAKRLSSDFAVRDQSKRKVASSAVYFGQEHLLIGPREGSAHPTLNFEPTVGLEAITTKSVETFSGGAHLRRNI